jgi:hypothetical protein
MLVALSTDVVLQNDAATCCCENAALHPLNCAVHDAVRVLTPNVSAVLPHVSEHPDHWPTT